MIKTIQDYLKQQKIPIDLSDVNISFLAQGEYNQNYLLTTPLNRYVFRINMGSQINLANQITYESCALKRLEVSKRTPKLFFVDDSKKYIPHGILIMEFLEGQPLDYRTDLVKAAQIFQEIHQIPINSTDYQTFITENYLFSDRIKEGQNLLFPVWNTPHLSKEIKQFFEKFLNTLINQSYNEKYFIDNSWHVICNTEVNSHNFIIGDNHSWLIDWEKPVITDPTQDITQFLAPTTTLWKQNTVLTDTEKETFFTHYELAFKDKNIRERVRLYTPYLYLRALSWCAYAFIEYQNPQKTISNPDTYKKIQEYLNIDFMTNLIKEQI